MTKKARKYVPVKCKWCGEKIEKEEDRVKLQITEKTSVNLHKHCEGAYLEDREQVVIETKKWDTLYNYVRFEILNYTKEKQLSPNQRRRLQSLRSGEMIVKGTKVEGGYDYDVILTTFKAKRIDIEKATYNKTFDTENGKFNYIMAIIENSINDIAKRLEQRAKEKEKEVELVHTISDVDIKETFEEYKHIKEQKKETSKKSDLFEELW